MSHRTDRDRAPAVSAPANAALTAYAKLFCFVSRTLHARMEAEAKTKGEAPSAGSFKRAALKEFGLTGRQFNAIAVSLEGRRKSTQACRALNIENATDRIGRLERVITGLRESLTKGRLNKERTKLVPLTEKQKIRVREAIHQKARSLGIRERKLTAMKAEESRGVTSMCFGSRVLFNKQFRLEANGYTSHDEWLADWRLARSNQFLVRGSRDENSGCDGCVATLAADGSISLSIGLPKALQVEHGKAVGLHGIRFDHGHAAVVAALQANQAHKTLEKEVRAECRKSKTKFSEKAVPGGTALTWRLLCDAKGWEVLVSVVPPKKERISVEQSGRVAVDLNADHLAVAETDYYGNWVNSFSVPCRTAGRSSDQASAVIGDAVKFVVAYAAKARKPLVLEKLDFKHKKCALTKDNPVYARMLSSLAYNKTKTLFEARAWDAGLELFFVNPAFTSVIGRVKYSMPLGITTHEAAALAIARRSQGVRERAPQPNKRMLVSVKAGTTAWTSPDWMKPQHRAQPWRCVNRSLPGLYQREPARKTPAAPVSGTRKRTRTVAGAVGDPPV